MIKRIEVLPAAYRDLTLQLAVLQKDRTYIANRMEIVGRTPELRDRDAGLLREIRRIESNLRYLKARTGVKTRSEFAVRFKNVAREFLDPELYQRLISETNASFRAPIEEEEGR